MERIRVWIIDPDEDVRHWLGRLLDRTEGYACTGQYAGVDIVLALTSDSTPDLVLIEANLAASGKDTFKKLKIAFPAAKFALMDLEDGSSYENVSRRLGADAFLSKAHVPESLAGLRRIITPTLEG